MIADMSGLVEHAWARNEDIPEVLALFSRAYGRDLPPGYYEWQFLRGPAGGGYGAVARTDGHIVSHAGYSPRRCVVDGRDSLVAMKYTSMTDPDYQGHGIYTSLLEWAHGKLQDEGFAMVLSSPNIRNHPSQRNRTDYRDLCYLPVMLWTPDRPARPQEVAVPFRQIGEVDAAAWEPLARTTSGAARYCLVRSLPYLRWRLAQHPCNTYYVIDSWSGGVLEAVLVFKLYPESQPDRINVVEWFCNPDDRSGASVLEALETWAAAVGLPIMLWHNLHDYPRYHILERRGYRPAEPIFYFGLFPLAAPASLGPWVDWRHWYVTMCDSDVF